MDRIGSWTLGLWRSTRSAPTRRTGWSALPKELGARAGQGVPQGADDAGPLPAETS